jgi:hypothetical protein
MKDLVVIEKARIQLPEANVPPLAVCEVLKQTPGTGSGGQ